MSQEPLQHRRYFKTLVEHLDQFGERQRDKIAQVFGASASDAASIARCWFDNPERFAEVMESKLASKQALHYLYELAIEHDIPMDIEWIAPRLRKKMTDLGLVHAYRMEDGELMGVVPGAIAAMLAPRLAGMRPSLPVMLGRYSQEQVTALAKAYDVPVQGTRIEMVMALSEYFARPEAVEMMMERLPDPEWIAAAMMILELGGTCFWPEIFGYDLDATLDEDRKVVPFMRANERNEEREIAETLLELGILYRVEAEQIDAPYAMVAVPEELWKGLWKLGRGWLAEWMANSYQVLTEHGARRPQTVVLDDIQASMKMFVLETEREALTVDATYLPTPQTHERIQKLCDPARPPSYVDTVWSLAMSLGVLAPDDDGKIVAHDEHKEVLDLARPAFVRHILSEWCAGMVGALIDMNLGLAVGLDDSWRRLAIEALIEDNEVVPLWMFGEGVPSGTTGAGNLRDVENGTHAMITFEMDMTNSFVWTIKLLWLDLLSLLEAERWYPIAGMVELFQFTACLSLFSHLQEILENPNISWCYLPLQRTSFFTDPYHAEQFEIWVRDLIEHLFSPLGLAAISEDGESVWLDTRLMRIESPWDWPDEDRLKLLREIFQDETFEFRLPSAAGTGLRAIGNAREGIKDGVRLSESIDTLRSLLKGKKIKRFDGVNVFF